MVALGYKEGTGREQSMLWALDDLVPEKSMARIIGRFIDVLDLGTLGFTRAVPAGTGRPVYPPQALAKLYVYGYENGIRSPRKLEREARRNVEAMWLLDGLTPDHKTISEFRRENIRPLQKLFREFVRLCGSWELVGGGLIAVDGTQIKAGNNKKNNFSRKKLTERLARLDDKIAEYLAGAETEDAQEETVSGSNEVSAVDLDARLMGNNRGGVDMAYNVHSAADGKHDLLVDWDVSLNPSDQGQLSRMAKRLKRLGYRHFTLLADRGYYNGEDLKKVKRYKIKAVVSRQRSVEPKKQPQWFRSGGFHYDAERDACLCPAGQTLYPHKQEVGQTAQFLQQIRLFHLPVPGCLH